MATILFRPQGVKNVGYIDCKLTTICGPYALFLGTGKYYCLGYDILVDIMKLSDRYYNQDHGSHDNTIDFSIVIQI